MRARYSLGNATMLPYASAVHMIYMVCSQGEERCFYVVAAWSLFEFGVQAGKGLRQICMCALVLRAHIFYIASTLLPYLVCIQTHLGGRAVNIWFFSILSKHCRKSCKQTYCYKTAAYQLREANTLLPIAIYLFWLALHNCTKDRPHTKTGVHAFYALVCSQDY